MSEDKESRTEQPTGKKLAEQFDEGNFPRAPEISVAFTLIASFAMFTFWGKGMATQLMDFSRWIFGHLHEYPMNPTAAAYYMPNIFLQGLGMMAPFLLVCMLAAIAAGGLQTGFKLTPNVLKFNFDKLNFINGFKSLFSNSKLVSFGIELVKFSVMAWIIWGVLLDIQKDPIFYTAVPVSYVAEFIYQTFLTMLSKLIFAIGVLAAAHYAYAKWKFIEDNKMTKQQVEDEMKNAEGNAQVKGARKKMAYAIAYRQILTKVPLADVIVTNPTHFAVALKYERGKDAAPVCLAKGKDILAQRIKQIAAKHGVPMVENRPVARALYKHATAGKSIPAPLYQAVAQILAYVYRTYRYYFHRLKARRLETRA